jgi:hypothetical protein
MKICPKCSSENDDTNAFCLYCGADLNENKEEQSEVTEDNGYSPTDYSPTDYSQNGYSQTDDSQATMYNDLRPVNNAPNPYNGQQYPQNGTQPQYQAGQGAYQNGGNYGGAYQGGGSYGGNTYNNANNNQNSVNATPYIVWSIINLVCCCMPLGIAGLIFAIQINSASSYEEAENKRKTAMILCIIGTVFGFVIGVIYVLLSAIASL